MRHQRAPIGAEQKILRDAAERPFPDPAVPVGASDDEVGLLLGRNLTQPRSVIANGTGRDRLRADAMALQPAHDVCQMRTRRG